MKTSTKIYLILFAITSIASTVLAPNVTKAVQISTAGVSFNFSVLSYVALALIVLSNIFGTILYFRFLKTLSFNKVIFFSTLPFTLIYGTLLFSLAYLSSLDNPTANGVKTLLNISTTNQYNTILWAVLLTIIYILVLFIVYFFVSKPVERMEKILLRLGDGKIKERKFNLGGGKQFAQMGHALLKINNTFSGANENLTGSKVPKILNKFIDEQKLLRLQNGEKITHNAYLVFCRLQEEKDNNMRKEYDLLKLYINEIEPLVKKFSGIAIENANFGSCSLFFRAENALDFAHAVCRVVKIKSKRTSIIKPFIVVDNEDTSFFINEKSRVMLDENNFESVREILRFSMANGCRLTFTNKILDNLPSNYLLKYRYVGKIYSSKNLFESLEVYSRKKREKLDKNKQDFEKAVLFFNRGEKERARIIFENILRENPNDKVSYLYFNQCKN